MKLFGFQLNTPMIVVLIVVALLVLYGVYRLFFGSNKEGFSDSNKKVLVLYYSPRCGHCTAMMPEWDKVDNAHKGDSLIEVKKVNGDKESDKAASAGIEGYPTIILYTGGEKNTFTGDRTAEALESFLVT